MDNVSPPIGVSPIVRGSEFSVEEEEDEDDEESVSEWELERLREKVNLLKIFFVLTSNIIQHKVSCMITTGF